MLGQGDTDVTIRVGAGLPGVSYVVTIVSPTLHGNVLEMSLPIEILP